MKKQEICKKGSCTIELKCRNCNKSVETDSKQINLSLGGYGMFLCKKCYLDREKMDWVDVDWANTLKKEQGDIE